MNNAIKLTGVAGLLSIVLGIVAVPVDLLDAVDGGDDNTVGGGDLRLPEGDVAAELARIADPGLGSVVPRQV
jgi:hypothetical protein